MRTMVIPLYGYLNSGIKKIWNIREVAKQQNLNVSDQCKVGTHIIALDTIKRKMLITNVSPDTSSCLMIDLTSVETCSIKKEYKSVNAGELKTKKLRHFLKSIFLNLVFKKGADTVSIPLFDSQKEQQGNMEQLEMQVKKCENIVSKLLLV